MKIYETKPLHRKKNKRQKNIEVNEQTNEQRRKKRKENQQQKICKIKVNFKKYINKDMVMDKPA